MVGSPPAWAKCTGEVAGPIHAPRSDARHGPPAERLQQGQQPVGDGHAGRHADGDQHEHLDQLVETGLALWPSA